MGDVAFFVSLEDQPLIDPQGHVIFALINAIYHPACTEMVHSA